MCHRIDLDAVKCNVPVSTTKLIPAVQPVACILYCILVPCTVRDAAVSDHDCICSATCFGLRSHLQRTAHSVLVIYASFMLYMPCGLLVCGAVVSELPFSRFSVWAYVFRRVLRHLKRRNAYGHAEKLEKGSWIPRLCTTVVRSLQFWVPQWL
jgi:hypothetical protein